MDSVRWETIQDLFHRSADLSTAEQRRFLTQACAGDETLAAEVLALLAEDAGGKSLLDRDVAYVADSVLEGAAPSLPFEEFGPYQVRTLLGEGGMGVVYLAERMDIGSLVAIKILRDAWLSPARRERFAAEQRTLAQLNHPAIARIYDAGTVADGTPYFVMEYVDGTPLTAYVLQHNCSLDRRLLLFREVCEAVQYAHSHAFIHRDLKPSNILVKADGSVKLLDFGIAKQVESLEMQRGSEPTMTGLRFMTPAYAAPEQMRGEHLGAHSDVYSLGVILYELLTGQRPFDFSKAAPSEAQRVIEWQAPEKPSVIGRKLARSPASHPLGPVPGKAGWSDLDVLCLTAMHREPERRYRSAEALIRDIDHYLRREPLEARPDSVAYKAGKFILRNQRAVAIALCLFLGIVGLILFFTVRLAVARNSALAEAARTRRIQSFMLSLFHGGDEAGPSENLRVITLVDRGVQEARALDGAPGTQADLYQTLGGIYEKLGKFEPADIQLQKALERKRSIFGADSAEAAESLVSLGLLRASQAKYQEAERLVRDGLAISRRKLPPDSPALAKATFALGKVLEGRGAYDEAIAVLGEAVRIQSLSSGSAEDLAASLSELANCHFYAGHYETSDTLNHRVLAMNRQLHGEQHPLVADTLINLGAIQFQLGHFRESEQFNRRALDIVEAWYGKDHPETADTMTILGQSLTYQQRFAEAADLLQQSLAILERVYGPVHPRVAYAVNELGNVAIRQGKLEDAEADFNRAIRIYRSIYGDRHYLTGLAQANLAGVYSEKKEYARAERLFRETLQIYAKTLPPEHMNVGICRIRLGNALLGERRYRDAQAESETGYQILAKRTSPSLKWVQMARKDLAAEYDALHQPEKAATFRAQLGALDIKPAAEAGKK